MTIIAVGIGLGWMLFGRPISVTLVNGLAGPMVVIVPGGDSLRLAVGERRGLELPSSGFARLLWSAEPVRDAGGQPVGTAPSGEVKLQAGRGGQERTIGLGDAQVPMLEVLITNESSVALRLIVNAGLAGAAECHCLVEPGVVQQSIGYYPLFQNSTVRALGGDGRSAMFQDLGPQVDRRLRKIGLRFEEKDLR